MKKIKQLIYVTLLLITSTVFGQKLPKFVFVEGGTFTMGDKTGLGNLENY